MRGVGDNLETTVLIWILKLYSQSL